MAVRGRTRSTTVDGIKKYENYFRTSLIKCLKEVGSFLILVNLRVEMRTKKNSNIFIDIMPQWMSVVEIILHLQSIDINVKFLCNFRTRYRSELGL